MLAEAGLDPAEVALYAFGGAGGLHAGAVAELAGINRVRSFAAGGVFSARGVFEAAAGSGDDMAANWQRSTPSSDLPAASSDAGGETAGPALINISGAVHAIPTGWTARPDGADSLLWERVR